MTAAVFQAGYTCPQPCWEPEKVGVLHSDSNIHYSSDIHDEVFSGSGLGRGPSLFVVLIRYFVCPGMIFSAVLDIAVGRVQSRIKLRPVGDASRQPR